MKRNESARSQPARVKITLMLEASWGDVLAVPTVSALVSITAGGIVGGLAQKLVLQTLRSLARPS